MSAEIKSGTEGCKSTIEHETAGILRCQGLHLRQAFPTVHGNGQHGWDDSDPRIIPPTPWRFDVPEVPAHVTALRSINESREVDHCVWVRVEDAWALEDRWAQLFPDGYIGTARLSLLALAPYAPLVECPDPRAAS